MSIAASPVEAVVTNHGGVDTYEWLEVIARDPKTTNEQLLAAHAALGTETDLTDEQIHEGVFWLQMFGFLWTVDISADERTWTYELRIPATE